MILDILLSLGIAVKGPEGLVLAADSRVTVVVQPKPPAQGAAFQVSFDNARKVLQFVKPHTYVGAVTYGEGGIGLRSAPSFLPEFESSLPTNRLSIADFAQRLSDFFMQQWRSASMPVPPQYRGPGMTFVVGGFNDAEPYGRVYLFVIPYAPVPVEQNPNPGEFGITWGGQREFVDRLIQGFDARVLDIAKTTLNLGPAQVQQLQQALAPLSMQVPIEFLALQDCIDLAIFFIRTTIAAQELSVGIRGVGGPIDVATITRVDGFKFIQQKQLEGETATRT